VNACPEAAIEIEIVNMAEWRANYADAESPGMPAAKHTISTTRITLPPEGTAVLERVDAGRIRPEHPHFSLIAMTTMIQCSVGSLVAGVLYRSAGPGVLACVLGITIFALNISVFHLGRPAYAWRALKMWRRSWLSREVALFGLFFLSIMAVTMASWVSAAGASTSLMSSLQRWSPLAAQLLGQPLWPSLLPWLGWISAVLGIGGIVASAFIYLVPARPAWNMTHTPIDFLLSAGLLGATLLPLLTQISNGVEGYIPFLGTLLLPLMRQRSGQAVRPQVILAALWLVNQLIRALRLRHSALFEARASAELLNTTDFRAGFILLAGLSLGAGVLSITGAPLGAFLAALGAVLMGRYLFFVTVVPLNMALTFVRASH
jgi:formate dehydrogenase iron-sulfur subunit